jgi:hypothetical protein
VVDQAIGRVLASVPGRWTEPWDTIDGVHGEAEPVDLVHDRHVERRRRRALFLVSAHVGRR